MKNNAAGGKGSWGDRADGAGKDEGVAGATGPKDPGGDKPRAKVRELQRRLWAAAKRAPGRRFHALYDHLDLNPALQGWGNYFRTGNPDTRIQLDSYVSRRRLSLRLKRKGRGLQPGEAAAWTREYFESLGLYRLRGTVRHPASPFWESRNAAA